MKVILTPDMAMELFTNEEQIKNQEGQYRPRYNPVTRRFESVIKCFPLEKKEGGFIQQRDVITGMESEVDDICMAKIVNHTITYKVNEHHWCPPINPFNQQNPVKMDKYSIMIYTPKFDNDTIFLTSSTLPELFNEMKKYNIGKDVDTSDIKLEEGIGVILDYIFAKYQGICTYLLFKDEDVVRCGKWDNKKYW